MDRRFSWLNWNAYRLPRCAFLFASHPHRKEHPPLFSHLTLSVKKKLTNCFLFRFISCETERTELFFEGDFRVFFGIPLFAGWGGVFADPDRVDSLADLFGLCSCRTPSSGEAKMRETITVGSRPFQHNTFLSSTTTDFSFSRRQKHGSFTWPFGSRAHQSVVFCGNSFPPTRGF